MRTHQLPPFFTVFIAAELIIILFFFYFIGSELYNVSSLEKIFSEDEKEIALLEKQKEAVAAEVKIRSTPEYFDRFQKENKDIYQKGEIVVVLPASEKEIPFEKKDLSEEELQKEILLRQPIIDQWKSVFSPSL